MSFRETSFFSSQYGWHRFCRVRSTRYHITVPAVLNGDDVVLGSDWASYPIFLGWLELSGRVRTSGRPTMELCIGSSSGSATLLFNQSSSRPSLCLAPTNFVPLYDSLLQFKKNRALASLTLTLPFYQQTSSQSRRCSSPFVASASSSSVAAGDEIDQLPASIKVTEIHEPNSRVSLFLSCILHFQFIVFFI